ncbi:PrsW family glutamic-type intramembrane protease [Allorhodopirellula solitaria]|uniref:Protease PrsW n=1 Tax=Allorhodopirellula solitaria TaxID=2527987 RepID=A0A5C5YH21_9BACT|nr:PrsW family glutamic-type intramembrane protease [Allorhodopirellula solitaria]TWT74399.1 hypothetical protein CA85_12880 [Allorhodopirellula solitaria]
MNQLPSLLALFPTLVWVLIWIWIRPATGAFKLLIVGLFAGASLAIPVWLAETLVDQLADPQHRWSRDFLEQVIGAACCEEGIKFAGVMGILKWFDKTRHKGTSLGENGAHPWDAVPCALVIAIGFMTVENLIAITAAPSPTSMALSRQMTLLAGHPSYQLVMGYSLARWRLQHKAGWMIAAIAVPIFLHGWGDFSEQLFQDEPDHGSTRDTIEFVAWIGSITASLIASVAVLASVSKRPRI